MSNYTTKLMMKKGPDGQLTERADVAVFQQVIREAAAEFLAASAFRADVKDAARAIDRVAATLNAAAVRNPEIFTCTPASIGRAIYLCVVTGLTPGGGIGGQCDLIPRKNKDLNNALELNWQLGWRGYTALAARAGRRCKANLVFVGDEFEHEEGLDERLRHVPHPEHEEDWTWAGLTGAYVVVRSVDNPNDRDFLFMRKKAIEQRRKKAQSPKFWNEWPMEMALKTVIRNAGQRGILVLDEVGQHAMEADMAFDQEVPTARVVDMGRTRALPDMDPLGQGEYAGREAEPVRIDAGNGGIEDLVDAPADDAQDGPDEAEEQRMKQLLERQRADAEALRTKLGDWKVPLTKDQLKAALCGALGVSSLRPPDRLDHAIDFGIEAFGWRRTDNGRLLPALPATGGQP